LEFAELFDIAVAVPGTEAYHCFKPFNLRTVTTAVTFLSTYFTKHLIKELGPNSTVILVSEMVMLSVSMMVIGGWVLFKKGEIICMCKSMQLDGLNSNFF
jgi:hypothetical protein